MDAGDIEEIVIAAHAGVAPITVAEECVRRLELADGVRIAVRRAGSTGRPQRFVVYEGRITTPHHYAAVTLTTAVEALLRREGRPLDAWGLLQAGRQADVFPAGVTMATITQAARLLARQGRVEAGQERGTWSHRAVAVAA